MVRLYDTILGQDGFRKGMDLYFKRHDGTAVTCDDFLAAMADANGEDLSTLGKWCASANGQGSRCLVLYVPCCSFAPSVSVLDVACCLMRAEWCMTCVARATGSCRGERRCAVTLLCM